MKTRVDIITGFLGGGKTTYINALLHDENLKKEKTVVLQFEAGEAVLASTENIETFIFLLGLKEQGDLDAAYLQKIKTEYTPKHIILELNGFQDLDAVLQLFEQRQIRKEFVLGSIACLVDAPSFLVLKNNMGELYQKQIAYADHIILNKITNLQTEVLLQVEKELKGLNKKAELFYISTAGQENPPLTYEEFQNASIYKDASRTKMSTLLFSAFSIFALAYLLFSFSQGIGRDVISFNLLGFEAFLTVFISILMQAFQFMLIGVLLSALMQVFLSNETIIKFFPRKYGLGFVTAMFGGLLLPVCECAIVPMMAGLVKKGVSLPVAVTFMLAAPIINPIVIFSTLYAFPGYPQITVYRIYFGLVIALAVGLILTVFPEKEEVLLKNAAFATDCDCLYCSGEMQEEKSFLEKCRFMFLHAAEEFFSAGKYLVLGAALTTFFQMVIPNDIFLRLWNREGLALLVMMATSFLFSLCSTSDAFIARSFWNSFSTSSILGFLVFGPMMDIKNIFMLFGAFRKAFVLKLVLIITLTAFIMLYIMTSLLL